MGGEKEMTDAQAIFDGGLPPRGRGKAFSVLRRQFRFRITPAWAGKSLARELLLIVSKDYPRVGGEKLSQLAMGLVAQGSPPRGRGKATVPACCLHIHRITPA